MQKCLHYLLEIFLSKFLYVMLCTLTLCIRETPKQVLLQIVRTKIKRSVMVHFI